MSETRNEPASPQSIDRGAFSFLFVGLGVVLNAIAIGNFQNDLIPALIAWQQFFLGFFETLDRVAAFLFAPIDALLIAIGNLMSVSIRIPEMVRSFFFMNLSFGMMVFRSVQIATDQPPTEKHFLKHFRQQVELQEDSCSKLEVTLNNLRNRHNNLKEKRDRLICEEVRLRESLNKISNLLKRSKLEASIKALRGNLSRIDREIGSLRREIRELERQHAEAAQQVEQDRSLLEHSNGLRGLPKSRRDEFWQDWQRHHRRNLVTFLVVGLLSVFVGSLLNAWLLRKLVPSDRLIYRRSTMIGYTLVVLLGSLLILSNWGWRICLASYALIGFTAFALIAALDYLSFRRFPHDKSFWLSLVGGPTLFIAAVFVNWQFHWIS